jgi:hypothetical protein
MGRDTSVTVGRGRDSRRMPLRRVVGVRWFIEGYGSDYFDLDYFDFDYFDSDKFDSD